MLGLMRRKPTTLDLSPFKEVDRFFDDVFNSFPLSAPAFNIPTMNVYSEDDRHMVVEVEVPGYDRKDIQLSIDNGVLEIRGERTEKEEHNDKKRSFMVRESSQSFARRILLPEGADSDKIAAELDKGVLKVTIPVEQGQAKRIEIATPKSGGQAKLTATTEK
jgi:HSP20 family protein